MTYLFFYSLFCALVFLLFTIVHKSKQKQGFSKTGTTDLPEGAPWAPLFAIFTFKMIMIVLLLSTGFTAMWSDDPTRWLIALDWSQRPWFAMQEHVWLSMSFYVYGIAIKVIPDPLIATRFVNLLVSMASIYAMYLFGSRLFKNKNIGLAAAFIFATIPMHTWLSVMTMSDVFYLMFMGSSLGLFLDYINRFSKGNPERARKSALLMGFSVMGLTATRYEGWILAFCIALAFWIHWFAAKPYKKGLEGKLLFHVTLLMAVYPVLWMLSSWIDLGSPLGFFRNQARYNELGNAPFKSNAPIDKIMRYPRELYSNFGYLLPFSVLGFIMAFYHARKRALLGFGAGIALVYIILMEVSVLVGGTSMALSRCVQYFIFLLIPFTLYPVFVLLESEKPKNRNLKIVFLSALSLPLVLYVLGNIPGNIKWSRHGWEGEGTVMARYLQTELRNPEDFPFLKNGNKIVIWTNQIKSPDHLLLRKICANKDRIVFIDTPRFPEEWVHDHNLLIIGHNKYFRGSGWVQIKRFGSYRFYRPQ